MDQETIFVIPPHCRLALALIMVSKIKTRSFYIPKLGTSSPNMVVLRVADPSVSVFSARALSRGISSSVSGRFAPRLCLSVAQRLQMWVLHRDKTVGVISVLGLQPLSVVRMRFLSSCSSAPVS